MSTATLSTYDEVLKTFYLPAGQDQLSHGTILNDLIEPNEEDVSGKDAKIFMRYGRSTGTGARKDNEKLPSAGYQPRKQATVPMKYNYGRIQVSGPTIGATRDERGAYARAMDQEITGIVADLQMEVNRAMWGCGYGILARWRDGATTTITLQKKYRSNSAGGDGFGSTFGAKYLGEERGQATPVVLGSMSSASAATYTVDATDINVSAISEGTAYDTITCANAAVTEAVGTFYVRFSNTVASLGALASNGTHRKEMMGLRGIVTDTDIDEIAANDGTDTGLSTNDPLQLLDVSTYPWFKANVDSHSSGRYAGQRALTLNLMDTMFDKIEEKAGKDYGPDLILTTRALRREYVDLCRADRRYVNTMTLDGGWKVIDYNGVAFTVDNDAIDGEIYFLTTKDLQVYRMSDYDWMNKDGAILSRVSGYDAYEAVIFRYAELGVKRRNSQGVITDLNYTL